MTTTSLLARNLTKITTITLAYLVLASTGYAKRYTRYWHKFLAC